jgi:hypothetical protein
VKDVEITIRVLFSFARYPLYVWRFDSRAIETGWSCGIGCTIKFCGRCTSKLPSSAISLRVRAGTFVSRLGRRSRRNGGSRSDPSMGCLRRNSNHRIATMYRDEVIDKVWRTATNTSNSITTVWMKSSRISSAAKPNIHRESWIDGNNDPSRTHHENRFRSHHVREMHRADATARRPNP